MVEQACKPLRKLRQEPSTVKTSLRGSSTSKALSAWMNKHNGWSSDLQNLYKFWGVGRGPAIVSASAARRQGSPKAGQLVRLTMFISSGFESETLPQRIKNN